MKNTLTHMVYYEKTIFDGILEKWDKTLGLDSGPRILWWDSGMGHYGKTLGWDSGVEP